MHRIESDNVDVSAGKNQFKDGPPGTTVNAAIMNALQEEICAVIEGYGLNIGTKANDSKSQMWQVISGIMNKNGRSATWIFASSDSEAKSQSAADTIIPTSADAAAIIKAKAAALSALGGGSILCLEGTYNCYTELDWSSYVDLIGCGYRTVFKRMAATLAVIDASNGATVRYCKFDNFRIDGNRAVYGGGASCGIAGNNSYIDCSFSRIIVHSHQGTLGAMVNCHNCNNCIVYDSNISPGFAGCNGLNFCISSSHVGAGSYGFASCYRLTNCNVVSNSVEGFSNCTQLNNCSVSSTVGTNSAFSNCFSLTNCYALSNGGEGFNACLNLNNCIAQTNNNHGFKLCKQLVGCKSISNAVSAYHYTSCFPMQQCLGASGGSAWRSCFADFGGTSATADTAAGGYNKE
jgi:hypothetical protein